jgi:GT2 family glycosyltransferase
MSILIPERANPDLLSECLASVNAACRMVDEPCEVIVVVNGSPQSLYRELVDQHKPVRWIFSEAPLWFGGAVQRGLEAARYDWVYLLNNDMVLDALAFSSLLPWRAPHVFGIASQIYFQDPEKRREETGWTVCRQMDGMIEILDDVANDDSTVRGTFYPGGGASLFRRDLLARLARQTSVYAPFYWEDVEWGTCAWRLGYESLYCPASKAWHGHRQTNRKFFSEPEIERILNRNRFIFHLRNGPCSRSFKQFRELLAQPGEASLAEILTGQRVFEIAYGRLRNRSRRFRDLPLDSTSQRIYGSTVAGTFASNKKDDALAPL